MNCIEYCENPKNVPSNWKPNRIQYCNTICNREHKINTNAYNRAIEIQNNESVFLLKEAVPDVDAELAVLKNDLATKGIIQAKHLSKKFWDKLVKIPKKAYDIELEVSTAMIEGMWSMFTTKEGLLLFGEIELFHAATKIGLTLISQSAMKIVSTVASRFAEPAAEMVGEGIMSACASNLSVAFETTLTAVKAAVGLETEVELAVLCPVCAPVIAIIGWITWLGIIIDILDPWNCSAGAATVQALDANVIAQYEYGFNTAFKEQVLNSSIGTTYLSTGDVIINDSIWPIQFPGNNLFDNDLILPHEDTLRAIGMYNPDTQNDKTWEDVKQYYRTMYLTTTTINSMGLAYYIPPESDNDDIIDMKKGSLKFKGALALKVSNNNPEVANWVYKWWPIIILIFIIILYFIIKLVK